MLWREISLLGAEHWLQNVLSVLPSAFCHVRKILRFPQRSRKQVLPLAESFNIPAFPWGWGALCDSGFYTSELLLTLRISEPFLWLEGVSQGLGLLMMCARVHGCGTWGRGSLVALAVLWEQLDSMVL